MKTQNTGQVSAEDLSLVDKYLGQVGVIERYLTEAGADSTDIYGPFAIQETLVQAKLRPGGEQDPHYQSLVARLSPIQIQQVDNAVASIVAKAILFDATSLATGTDVTPAN